MPVPRHAHERRAQNEGDERETGERKEEMFHDPAPDHLPVHALAIFKKDLIVARDLFFFAARPARLPAGIADDAVKPGAGITSRRRARACCEQAERQADRQADF